MDAVIRISYYIGILIGAGTFFFGMVTGDRLTAIQGTAVWALSLAALAYINTVP